MAGSCLQCQILLGLSRARDEKSLKEAFFSFHEVSKARIMYANRSRGFVFVNFSKEDEASLAKNAMDGKRTSEVPN